MQAATVPPVMWILLSLLWLLLGVVLGYVVRGAKTTELLEYHNNKLLDLLMDSHIEHEPIPAKVRDSEAESPEAIAEMRISHAAISGLAAYIAESAGVSIEKATAEAEQMLGQFTPYAQETAAERTAW